MFSDFPYKQVSRPTARLCEHGGFVMVVYAKSTLWRGHNNATTSGFIVAQGKTTQIMGCLPAIIQKGNPLCRYNTLTHLLASRNPCHAVFRQCNTFYSSTLVPGNLGARPPCLPSRSDVSLDPHCRTVPQKVRTSRERSLVSTVLSVHSMH